MSINTPEELESLRAAGVIARRVLEAMKGEVRPGITTRELDAVGARVMAEAGARSAPALAPPCDRRRRERSRRSARCTVPPAARRRCQGMRDAHFPVRRPHSCVGPWDETMSTSAIGDVTRDPDRRLLYVDSMRVYGVLLVLVIHVAEVFNPWDEWHISNAQRSGIVGEVVVAQNRAGAPEAQITLAVWAAAHGAAALSAAQPGQPELIDDVIAGLDALFRPPRD